MAVANLHETLLSYKLRRNQLNYEISQFQSQKHLVLANQADVKTLQNAETRALRKHFKEIYDGDKELQEKYPDYTEIPDFEDELDKILAKYTDQINELSAWETDISAQITTASAELQEVNAYIESLKGMLSSNIQEDFNFGGGQ